MNIFVVDKDPIVSAISLCNKHVVKMPLETAQMLCSVFDNGKAPYRRAYYNHPCSKWCRESIENYLWLVEHGIGLCNEYSFRYGRTHKCKEVIEWCRKNIVGLKEIGMTEFAQAMPDKYKIKNDAVKAYRNYYLEEKKHLFKYTKRAMPEWIAERF